MSELLSHAAAAAGAVAAFFLVAVALGVMLGADRLRDGALRIVGICVVIALLLGGLGELASTTSARVDLPATAGCTGGDPLVCAAIGVGHVVLAALLVLRRLRPRAREERAEERRRARMRERVRVSPRDEEIDP